MVADPEPIRGLGVRLTGQGRVLIASVDLDLIANRLTPTEAKGCALLLAHANLLDDVEMPSDGDDGWREYVDADPGLYADLAAWATGAHPHLRLLGPIQARTGTTGTSTVVAKRKAFYTELLTCMLV